MNDPLPTDDASARESVSLSTLVDRLARHISEAGPGDVAALRRLRPGSPQVGAYWKLLATVLEPADRLPGEVGAREEAERRWAVILAAMAEAEGFHAPNAKLGRVLAECGVPEVRVLKLLRASGDALADAVRVTVHHLVSRGARFDQTAIAALVLSDGDAHEERVRRGIYRDFFGAQGA